MEVDQFPLDLHWRWFDVALSWWRSPVEIAKIQERISPELHHFQRDINTFYASDYSNLLQQHMGTWKGRQSCR